jgi:hypothetical protein
MEKYWGEGDPSRRALYLTGEKGGKDDRKMIRGCPHIRIDL